MGRSLNGSMVVEVVFDVLIELVETLFEIVADE
jgi:hypothetical protein